VQKLEIILFIASGSVALGKEHPSNVIIEGNSARAI